AGRPAATLPLLEQLRIASHRLRAVVATRARCPGVARVVPLPAARHLRRSVRRRGALPAAHRHDGMAGGVPRVPARQRLPGPEPRRHRTVPPARARERMAPGRRRRSGRGRRTHRWTSARLVRRWAPPGIRWWSAPLPARPAAVSPRCWKGARPAHTAKRASTGRAPGSTTPRRRREPHTPPRPSAHAAPWRRGRAPPPGRKAVHPELRSPAACARDAGGHETAAISSFGADRAVSSLHANTPGYPVLVAVFRARDFSRD